MSTTESTSESYRLLGDLHGPDRYQKWHPRLADHQGPVVVIGCLNWDSYCHYLREKGKRVIGVDPMTTKHLPTFEHVPAAVGLYRGTAEIHGKDGGASLFWFHQPKIATVQVVTMGDILTQAGGDLAALKMNCEGSEAAVILSMTRPYADQITVAFHDRPGRDKSVPIGSTELYLPSVRDGFIRHLSQWYDYVQLTPREDNDWWFFLRRNTEI